LRLDFSVKITQRKFLSLQAKKFVPSSSGPGPVRTLTCADTPELAGVCSLHSNHGYCYGSMPAGEPVSPAFSRIFAALVCRITSLGIPSCGKPSCGKSMQYAG
jgi:hypothetical protein